MNFDTTVHLSDLLLMGGWVGTFIWLLVAFRDTIRDHSRDIKVLKDDVDDICDRQDRHHEWLIRSGADRRVIGERRRAEERRGET